MDSTFYHLVQVTHGIGLRIFFVLLKEKRTYKYHNANENCKGFFLLQLKIENSKDFISFPNNTTPAEIDLKKKISKKTPHK